MPAVAYPIELRNATRSDGATGAGTPGTGIGQVDAPSGTLGISASQAVAFADLADPVAANQARTYTREGTHNFRVSNVAISRMQVRRLTPRECERLQGFPDDYTLIPYRGRPAADGPRYKALGNSMAVPCMRWIGRRIQIVDAIREDQKERTS
jgi:DNA (cytosine-5)-methyltransferase 1